MSGIYSKHSADRFGDDLCEVLLSYLSFEDRFRCECLSKQWQRLVYKTLNVLKIGDEYYDWIAINFNALVVILKKCTNITQIDTKFTEIAYFLHLIQSVEKHCNHLNGIQFTIDKR